MLSGFLYDPLFNPFPNNNQHNNRRIRGWMPIWDEFDRMTHQILNDDDNWLPSGRNEEKQPEQKQLTNDKKLSSKKRGLKGTELATTDNTELATNSTSNNNSLSIWPRSNWDGQISLDLKDENDKYTVAAKVPGFAKENLKLQVKDGLLTVSGEAEEEKKDGNLYSKSTKFVSRSVALPENISEEKISAKFENGQLNVVIPKTANKLETKGQIMIE